VQRSGLSAEEKDNLQRQLHEANNKVRWLETRLQKMEWGLEKVNKYVVEVHNALDWAQMIRTNMGITRGRPVRVLHGVSYAITHGVIRGPIHEQFNFKCLRYLQNILRPRIYHNKHHL